ncbi:hypothetical protein CRYUN_Cryun41cG0061400 [Craigia yunnanensis]
MAASSTLLAVQYSAAVPVPRCQIRRNLVTKTLKTTIMAVNPAIQHEASVLVSTPPKLRRFSVTKRDKTIVAAYPELKIDITPGVPVCTYGELKNTSGYNLTLDDDFFWAGPEPEDVPKDIENEKPGKFTQQADSGGSIGSLEYVFGEGEKLKWVIAWSNAKNDLNKVYTQILKGRANWNEIKQSLDKATEKDSSEFKDGEIQYSSTVEIDRTSATPTMKATLEATSTTEATPEET